jgi:hypothetical protein
MPSDRGTISLTFQQFDINATWARLLLRSASLQLSLMSTETGCCRLTFRWLEPKPKHTLKRRYEQHRHPLERCPNDRDRMGVASKDF